MSDERNFPPEPVERRRVPAGQALLVVLVALCVGFVLNADRIDRTAQTQPFGWKRTWAMRITGPIRSISDATGLNKPREILSEKAGNPLPPPPKDTSSVVTAPPVDPGATTTTTAPIVLRTPTATDPLRVLVSGDSLMGWIGPALTQELRGQPMDLTEDWEVGSGLARPDVINWPDRLAEDMEADDPEVVVLGFGGNDAQDMSTDDGVVRLGTEEWAAEYQRRVAQILDVLEAPGRTVYWVGLPITTRDNIEEASPAMRAAVEAELAVRPWAHYVDSARALSPDGVYVTYLKDSSGQDVKVREGDGVHPNLAGATRIVATFAAELAEERKLG